MRTARFSGHLYWLGGDVCLWVLCLPLQQESVFQWVQGGVFLWVWGCLPQPLWPHPPFNYPLTTPSSFGQTDTCENITLSQTSFAVGKNDKTSKKSFTFARYEWTLKLHKHLDILRRMTGVDGNLTVSASKGANFCSFPRHYSANSNILSWRSYIVQCFIWKVVDFSPKQINLNIHQSVIDPN